MLSRGIGDPLPTTVVGLPGGLSPTLSSSLMRARLWVRRGLTLFRSTLRSLGACSRRRPTLQATLVRSDWIANLLMLVPMGVLATGAFWPRRERMLCWLAAGAALFCCLLLVLSIKYLQLFFPP